MVDSSCSAATGFYILPILACSFYSVLCILSLDKCVVQRLQRVLPFKISPNAPKENKDPNDPEALTSSREVSRASWPVWSMEFAKPSLALLLWLVLPMMGYALIRGLSDCEQYESVCWKVEAQSTSSHARNLLHVLAISIVLAWLCKVPPRTRLGCLLFGAVAGCELMINKYFWKNCENFLAHSVSSGSTFGAFDAFVALSTLLSLVMMLCEGLPSLRSRIRRLNPNPASEEHPEQLSFRGQRNYLLYWGFIVFFHGMLFVIFPEDLHLHHYWGGVVLATFCIFQTPLSRLLLLKGVMMAVDGIGVWGADAIVGEDEGGIAESDADLRLILCILILLAFVVAVGIHAYPRCRALLGTSDNKILDTE